MADTVAMISAVSIDDLCRVDFNVKIKDHPKKLYQVRQAAS